MSYRMMDISRDPVINVIYEGIKKPIVLCMENNCQRAALILVYSAIDSLAKLGLPEGESKSGRKQYAEWCDKYLLFNTSEKIKGIEWFAARCGLLHDYSIESDLSKKGEARIIGYYNGEGSDIKFSPEIDETMIMVRIEAIVETFCKSLDSFIIDLYANRKKETIQERFNNMFHLLPQNG